MSPKIRPIPEDWFHLSFDSLYPIIYGHRTIEAARPESLFSIEQTALNPNDHVLDLACGGGRHMAHLLEVTPHVVGLDYSPHLLTLAQDTLPERARLVRADMRHQPFNGTFDVVMNYFTSFGYFRTRNENLSVVHEIARALKPNGRFFIDYLNREWAEHNIQPLTTREAEGFEIRERRWIDLENHRINKTTVVSKNGNDVDDSGESVKLYTQDEFMELLSDGGLTVDRTFGDYDGSSLSKQTPRMIVVGHKT